MNRARPSTRVLLLVLGIGVLLTGCLAGPFAYDDGRYYSGWGGWHHGWDHSHWDQGGGGHGPAPYRFGENRGEGHR